MGGIEEFKKNRNEALLSLDREKILAFAHKYGLDFSPSNDEVFWRAVHKVRTAISDFPETEIEKSKVWLAERKSEHWADSP